MITPKQALSLVVVCVILAIGAIVVDGIVQEGKKNSNSAKLNETLDNIQEGYNGAVQEGLESSGSSSNEESHGWWSWISFFIGLGIGILISIGVLWLIENWPSNDSPPI